MYMCILYMYMDLHTFLYMYIYIYVCVYVHIYVYILLTHPTSPVYCSRREAVTNAGFNYSGALELGNVVDTQALGLGVHNAEWEAEAALTFLRTAAARISTNNINGFFLHFCTTLTHSPGPNHGICADPRLCEGGLLARPSAAAASGMPPRSEIFARAGGRRCGWAEFDASHTIWMDEQVMSMGTIYIDICYICICICIYIYIYVYGGGIDPNFTLSG